MEISDQIYPIYSVIATLVDRVTYNAAVYSLSPIKPTNAVFGGDRKLIIPASAGPTITIHVSRPSLRLPGDMGVMIEHRTYSAFDLVSHAIAHRTEGFRVVPVGCEHMLKLEGPHAAASRT